MNRIESIDQFRGFAILLMILANYMNNVQVIPDWLKHADDIGYTVVDLVAPLFVFAIGLTYGISFQRRLSKHGAWKTYSHYISRNLALLGMGYLITLIWELSGVQPPSVNWGLLQALGAAGLIALPFMRLSAIWRWGIGLGMLVLYQFLLDRYWLADVLVAPHNGPWGALSWGALLILATALADLFHDEASRKRSFPMASAGLVAAGLVVSIFVPLSKDRASASYELLSLGLSGLVFYLFVLIDVVWHLKLPILSVWGRNPLLLYLLHYVLLALYALPAIPGWYVSAPVWLVVLQLIVMIGILGWIGRSLDRRGLYFVL